MVGWSRHSILAQMLILLGVGATDIAKLRNCGIVTVAVSHSPTTARICPLNTSRDRD